MLIQFIPRTGMFLTKYEFMRLGVKPSESSIFHDLQDFKTKPRKRHSSFSSDYSPSRHILNIELFWNYSASFLALRCAADFYACPVVGPYGKWSAFATDIKESKIEDLDEEVVNVETMNGVVPKFFGSRPVEIDANLSPKKAKASNSSLPLVSADRYSAAGSLIRNTFGEIQSPRGPGPIAPHMCVSNGSGLSGGIVGDWLEFQVKAKNKDGKSVSLGGGSIKIRMRPVGNISYSFAGNPSGNMDVFNARMDASLVGNAYVDKLRPYDMDCRIEWEVMDSNTGVYIVRYKYDKPGKYLLYVTYDGLAIAGCPFELNLISGAPCPRTSRIIGPAMKRCRASPSPYVDSMTEPLCGGKIKVPHNINQFTVIVCDEHGNRIPIGGHCLSVKGSQGAKVVDVIDNNNGSYLVSYVVYIPKDPIQKAEVSKLAKFEQPVSLAAQEEESLRKMDELKMPVYSEAWLDVLLFEQCVVGCPLKPKIINLTEVRFFYDAFDRFTRKGMTCHNIQILIDNGKYKEAAEAMQQLEQQVESKTQKENFVFTCEALDHSSSPPRFGCLESTCRDNVDESAWKQQEQKNVGAAQDEWFAVLKLREELRNLSSVCNERESLLMKFGRSLIQELQQLRSSDFRVLSEQYSYTRLEDENLVPLAESLDKQYQEMFKRKTENLIRLVGMLEKGEFDCLEELMKMYQHIGDELRKLHRYKMADTFDRINECLSEEIDLLRLQNIMDYKQKKLTSLDDVLKKREEALARLEEVVNKKKKEAPAIDDAKLMEISIKRRHKGVQTEDSLSLRQGIFGPLIVKRATGEKVPPISPVTARVQKMWKSCQPYDIHTTIKRLLRSCPRIKQCLNEVFMHYSKVIENSLSNKEFLLEGLPVGLTKTVFFKLCQELRLQRDFLNDSDQLLAHFDKFSIEPNVGRICAEGFLRIIPYFLWVPFIRELAYTNTLYKIAAHHIAMESQDAANPYMMSKKSHLLEERPSRLSTFHHFFRFHFLPLYECLYNMRDFQVVTKPILPPLPKFLEEKAPTDDQARTERYAREVLPFEIFSLLKLEPLEMLFIYYSELSMNPHLRKHRNDAKFPTIKETAKVGSSIDVKRTSEATIHATSEREEEIERAPATSWVSLYGFIEMMREFGMIPGYLSAERIFKIIHTICQQNMSSFFEKDVNSNDVTTTTTPQEGEQSDQQKDSKQSAAHQKRLFFSGFVESIVKCVVECVLSNPPASIDHHLLVEEARDLLVLFGFNDSNRILLHTRRPLRISPQKKQREESILDKKEPKMLTSAKVKFG